jgi:hypothetical protein
MMKVRVLLGCLLVMSACIHKAYIPPSSANKVCSSAEISFAKDVQPILRTNCAKAGCHDGQSMPHDFSIYEEVKLILPDSVFYYYVIKDKSMPQDSPLSESELQTLRCWASRQYPNN